jgi:hypothetical protein
MNMRINSEVVLQSQPADLTYNIASGVLNGRIGNTSISAQAGSGGRAGTTTPGALNWWLANSPLATRVKLQKKNSPNPGGPIPIGRYRVVPHESKKNRLRLLPLASTQMVDRDGMLIHRDGPRGSDGCIVPTDFAVVTLLCSLVHHRAEQGGAAILLDVIATGQDLDRQYRTA